MVRDESSKLETSACLPFYFDLTLFIHTYGIHVSFGFYLCLPSGRCVPVSDYPMRREKKENRNRYWKYRSDREAGERLMAACVCMA